MGDQDYAAGEFLQVMLQPRHALGVEVVGRFVEQQHVGLRQQQTRQRHAAPLAARQVRHARLVGRTAQCVHRHLDAAVDVPQVARVELFLQPGHLLHQFVGVVFAELGGDIVIGVEDLLLVAPGDDVTPDIERRVELGLLLQVAHLGPVGGPRLAGEFLVDPGHDLQQRRLTRAVDAHHPDLGVRIEAEPDVLEHLLAAGKGLGQALHLKNVLGGHGRTLAAGGGVTVGNGGDAGI